MEINESTVEGREVELSKHKDRRCMTGVPWVGLTWPIPVAG